MVRLFRPAAGLVPALALLKFGVQLAAIPGYGIFRDELYYLACGRRLAFGYVEFPPLIALIARGMTSVFGDGLFGIRLAPAVAGAALVFVTCLLARELGGGRFAQGLAGLAVIAAPAWLLLHHFLSPNAFEPLLWALCAWLAVRAIRTGQSRWWLWFGLVAGIGLLNKHSILMFGFGLALGLLLTPGRAVFRERRFWAGGAIALLIFLPHLAWQVWQGFPLIEFLTRAARVKNYNLAPAEFFGDQALMMNPVLVPLWLAGLGFFFFAEGGRRYRALGWTFVAVTAILLAVKGKPYYLLPAYPMLFAGGAVAAEAAFARRPLAWLRPASVALVAAAGAVLAPLAFPVLPVDAYLRYSRFLGVGDVRTERHKMGVLPQVFADMFGWENMAATVAEVYHKLPPEERARAVVYGQNYGEAGAIEYYARRYALPPAISGHNNYFLWGPGKAGEPVIIIGGREADHRRAFDSVERAATIVHPYAMPYESNLPVWLCRKLKVPFAEAWRASKHFE